MGAGWDRFLTDRDKQHLAVSGKRAPFGFGQRPALLIVDAHYRAVGLEREPLLESIKTWPMSCGLEGWEAVDRTVELLAAARAHGVPVFYTNAMEEWALDHTLGPAGARFDGIKAERTRNKRLPADLLAKGNELIADIAPIPGELVIKKAGPSAFQGTPLLFQLNYLGVDTVIVCGEVTSGCVRASVVDGATQRFRIGVVAECCFDRTEAAHWIALFDMDQKYADVIGLAEARAYFERIGAG